MRISTCLAILLTVSAAGGFSAARAEQGAVDPPKGAVLANVPPSDEKTIADFQQRVRSYLDLAKKAQSQDRAPKEKSKQSIENLDQRRKELAASIKASRANAKPGDLFTPDAATLFRRLLAKTLAGPSGARIRASMRRAEPVLGSNIRVNESYPSARGVPLQSTPPSLLLNLPPLPKGMDYRVIDHALLLRDTEANTVADILLDAFPKN